MAAQLAHPALKRSRLIPKRIRREQSERRLEGVEGGRGEMREHILGFTTIESLCDQQERLFPFDFSKVMRGRHGDLFTPSRGLGEASGDSI